MVMAFFIFLALILAVTQPAVAANGSASGAAVIELHAGADTVNLRTIDDTVSDYTVVLSSAEKTGRELLIKNELVVSGERSRRLWQWSKDALAENVFAELARQFNGVTLFECEGNGCGRSNVWSTLVFSEALIYGPSRDQHYRVTRTSQGELHVLYVVRRGNRRVHALYERIVPLNSTLTEGISAGGTNALAALAAAGMVELAVTPGSDGVLSPAAISYLERVGGDLAGFGAGEIYAVCHLYPAGLSRDIGGSRRARGEAAKALALQDPVVALLEASERCGATAANALGIGLASATFDGVAEQAKNRQRPDALRFKSFGVGPLQPSSGATNRIELIVPSRFVRE